MNIRLMPIDQLKAAEYNPRRPLSAAARRKLMLSLREFGLVEPLVWNESTGRLVGGHARLAILKELGWTEAPVSVVHLEPQREKALNIVLNNREAQGRFDLLQLAAILDELHELPEFDLTGFEEGDRTAMRLAPLDELPAETVSDLVEVTLSMSNATFAIVSPELDRLIGDHDLTCRVRHPAKSPDSKRE